jgi:hypothetical protein
MITDDPLFDNPVNCFYVNNLTSNVKDRWMLSGSLLGFHFFGCRVLTRVKTIIGPTSRVLVKLTKSFFGYSITLSFNYAQDS